MCGSKTLPHPEERAERASRRTHGVGPRRSDIAHEPDFPCSADLCASPSVHVETGENERSPLKRDRGHHVQSAGRRRDSGRHDRIVGKIVVNDDPNIRGLPHPGTFYAICVVRSRAAVRRRARLKARWTHSTGAHSTSSMAAARASAMIRRSRPRAMAQSCWKASAIVRRSAGRAESQASAPRLSSATPAVATPEFAAIAHQRRKGAPRRGLVVPPPSLTQTATARALTFHQRFDASRYRASSPSLAGAVCLLRGLPTRAQSQHRVYPRAFA